METKTDKLAYSKPSIVRVRLTPEQAVLSPCSTGVTGLVSALNQSCNLNKGCKSYKDTSGDFAATS